MIKPIALLLLASSLTGCYQYYQSTFPKKPPDYCCLVDRFPDGPKHLEEGMSNEVERASADPRSGLLKLKAPLTIPIDPASGEPRPASVGLFRTGMTYGPDALISLHATFQYVDGPLDAKAWSVAVAARDGGLNDLYEAKRLTITLRIKQGEAALNIGAGAQAGMRDPPAVIDTELYDAIFNQHQPFTLSLDVLRETGDGTATLTYQGIVKYRLHFKIDPDLHDTVFTTVGATLTDCCVDDGKFSAELLEFEILGKNP